MIREIRERRFVVRRVVTGAIAPLLSVLMFLPTSLTWADGTAAGTVIDNTALVEFDLGGTRISLNSNTVTVLVDERIDVLVTLLSPQTQVNAGAADRSLLFSVANTGNGTEAVRFSIDSVLGGDDFDPTPAVPAIYFDTDASGDFSPGDVAYSPGGNEPLLAADESINVLLVNNIPGGVVDGNVGRSELTATALSGAGAPGDVLANQGDGGVDAVIGTSGGAAAIIGEYVVGDVALSIVKSVVVVDPFGGSEAVPGATLSYTITVEVSNNGTAVNSVLTDPVPTNTSFVTSSISLNGGGLTDATDADSGELDVSGVPTVVVRLGDLTQADGVQTVSFQVTID